MKSAQRSDDFSCKDGIYLKNFLFSHLYVHADRMLFPHVNKRSSLTPLLKFVYTINILVQSQMCVFLFTTTSFRQIDRYVANTEVISVCDFSFHLALPQIDTGFLR